jgi:hypothetical protein
VEQVFFDLAKFKHLSITSFEMEEMTGRDSLDASARAAGPRSADSAPLRAFEFTIAHRNQLIAQSIRKVNGDVVPSPYTQWENWSLRTQEFVLAAYSRLNDATKSEIDSFIGAHFATPEEASEPTT